MSIFSDNQTKHFYALNYHTSDSAPDHVYVQDVKDSNLFRVLGIKNANWDSTNNKPASSAAGKALFTSDTINRKHILKIKKNEVKPTYFRNWTVTAPTANIVADTTYHIYFYLENMLGFGIQDRWDRVATYTAKTGDDAADVMQNLALDLWGKLNAAGPIKNDFDVYYGGTLVTESDFKTHTLPTATSGTDIVVKETLAGSGINMNELALRIHTNPYVYNVTMSTFDGTSAWGGQKELKGTPDTDRVYISAATKVLAMELYFLRNRGDLYDLNKDFYTSILNETNCDTSAAYYTTVDVDYAFSDGLGFTYYSNKQFTVAFPIQYHEYTTTAANKDDADKFIDALKGDSNTGDVNIAANAILDL